MKSIPETVSIAVAGAGAIGRRHVEAIAQSGVARLAAIVDPVAAARDYAASLGVAWYPNLTAMLDAGRADGVIPDGVIIATPNQMHVTHGLECVAARLPTLLEKPIATETGSARTGETVTLTDKVEDV
jgi:predicted dehydrogenase